MFMSDAVTSADQPKLSRAGRLLGLVRKLIDYGKELVATLHQRVETDLHFAVRCFGTADLALVLQRIRRGLLRANALKERLAQCASRLDAERKPRAAPAQRTASSVRSAAPPTDAAETPLQLPTEAEIAAWVRRRPIGAVIADICRDLGIMCNHPLWREIQDAVMGKGGSYTRLVLDIIDRGAKVIAQAMFPSEPPEPAPTGPP